MTDIEQKALALVREVLTERNLSEKRAVRREVSPYTEALCRAIEQHEAFRQEVSDAVLSFWKYTDGVPGHFERFIIAKPDPLVEAVRDTGLFTEYAEKLSAAIEKKATVSELGNELAFAVLGLESEPAGTKAVFEVELRGRKRKVTVE